MKSKDLKIIAVILAVALVFTVLASNAVSVASIVFLAKNDIQGAPAQQQQQAQPQQQQQSSNVTPGGNTSTTPDATQPSGDNGASTTPDATQPSGDNGSNATPDANKPADNGGATAAKKTDKEVLEIYTKLMNKAKADKPGYKKVEYQELPSDAQNRVIPVGGNLVGTLLGLVDKLDLIKTKEAAEADPEMVDKGSDMRWFPVYKCEKGCYLTDVSAIESTNYEDLGNGRARITIELKDEQNPEPMAEGASTSPSNTGAMFSPLSKADIDNTLNGGVVSAVVKDITYSLTYHDCKAIVEYDTKTNEIIKLEQYMNVAIKADAKVIGSKISIEKQELFNTMIITDFKY